MGYFELWCQELRPCLGAQRTRADLQMTRLRVILALLESHEIDYNLETSLPVHGKLIGFPLSGNKVLADKEWTGTHLYRRWRGLEIQCGLGLSSLHPFWLIPCRFLLPVIPWQVRPSR